MAKVSKADVTHLAKLARIALSSREADIATDELRAILNYVDKLNAINTEGVEPTSQVTGLIDVWRDDVVKPSPISQQELLKNAPQTKDGFIKVKKVL